MKKANHPNRGTSLEAVLAADNNLEGATALAAKRVIAWQLAEEMERRKLTKSAMAKLMKTSRIQLDRVLSPDDGNVTLDTLQRAAKAVGKSIKLELA